MDSPEKIINRLNLDQSRIKEELEILLLLKKEKADKRDFLNSKVREQRKKNESLREKRDRLNNEVQEFKRLREKSRIYFSAKRAEMSKIQEILNRNQKEEIADSSSNIRKRIEKLEWRIQTTSLKLLDEKSLIEQVRRLEEQLFTSKKIQELRQKLGNLRAEVTTSKAEGMIYHKRILELAEKSQEHHMMLREKKDEIITVQIKADEEHNEYLKAIQRIKALYQERMGLINQIKNHRIQLHQVSEKRKTELEFELSKELEENSLAKLKRGEKLTLDEFKMLAEKDKL